MSLNKQEIIMIYICHGVLNSGEMMFGDSVKFGDSGIRCEYKLIRVRGQG